MNKLFLNLTTTPYHNLNSLCFFGTYCAVADVKILKLGKSQLNNAEKSDESLTKPAWKFKYYHRQFFDEVAVLQGINNRIDWYKAEREQVFKFFGASKILDSYDLTNGTLLYCLEDIYPEFFWKPWLFSSVNKSIWNNHLITVSFLKHLQEEFNITQTIEWKYITQKQFKAQGGSMLISIWKNIPNLIAYYQKYLESNSVSPSTVFPVKPQFVDKKTQRQLFATLKKIFPEEKLEIDFEHKTLYYKNTKKGIKFDVFLPNFNLGVEYQELEPNYMFTVSSGIPLTQYKRHEEKQFICNQNSISIIKIPYTTNLEKITKILKDAKPEIFEKGK